MLRLLLAFGLALGCTLHAASKPNILFLFADDMRAESLGALGDPLVQTPNLDALARRGMIFRNAYCLGGNSAAVCTPSRNMLLSGNAYFRWKDHVSPMAGGKKGKGGAKGQLCPGEGPNLPLSFQAAGYETYHFGKHGNTALEIQAKFESNNYLKNDEGDRKDGEPGKEIADGAINFLTKRDASRPFLMYLAFANPHDPRVAADQYTSRYQLDDIKLPKNFLPQHPFDNGEMTIRDEALAPWPRPVELMRKQWLDYYAVLTALDGHIGRLIQTLKDKGQFDNTIIIFTADQGIALGSHGLLGKQNLYDAGMKVPFFFCGPGITQGENQALIYLLDIYPTLCDLVGAPMPQGIDGQSFKPVLTGQATQARRELFFSYRDCQRALRDERYKLIRYPQINRSQLFDLQTDAEEMHDLADDPAQSTRIAAMMKRLGELQTHYTDTLPLTSATPKPAEWTPPMKR
jgi:arylsulfatase A-like enzyme